MIKRIGTKDYNTNTAKRIAEFSSGTLSQKDYQHEELYRKRSGEYFLYCESKQEIIPFTYKRAKDWLKEAVNKDQHLHKIYESEFRNSDKENIEPTYITLSLEAKHKLRRLANEKGQTISKVIENLILNK